MSSQRYDDPVPRINPGRFTRAIVEGEAGEIEARLSRYGNWMVHVRLPGGSDWKLVCSGDLGDGVLVHKAPGSDEDTLSFGRLVIDRATRRVVVDDEEVSLSRKEFGLLLTLTCDPYRAFTKSELMRLVWGWEGRTRTLETHAGRLRRKLAAAGMSGLVVNVWGHGYRLADPCDDDPGGPRSVPPGSRMDVGGDGVAAHPQRDRRIDPVRAEGV